MVWGFFLPPFLPDGSSRSIYSWDLLAATRFLSVSALPSLTFLFVHSGDGGGKWPLGGHKVFIVYPWSRASTRFSQKSPLGVWTGARCGLDRLGPCPITLSFPTGHRSRCSIKIDWIEVIWIKHDLYVILDSNKVCSQSELFLNYILLLWRLSFPEFSFLCSFSPICFHCSKFRHIGSETRWVWK